MIQIKDILKAFTVSHTTVYKHIDKLWIEKTKKDDNTVYISEADYEKLKDSIGRKNMVIEESKIEKEGAVEESYGEIVEDNFNQDSNVIEEYSEKIEQLDKRNKVLETQIKEYWEAIMTYKWENRELKEKIKEVEEVREKERSEYIDNEKKYISNIGEKEKTAIQYKMIMIFLWVLFLILILWLVFDFISL